MQDDPTEEMQNKQAKENNAERKRAIAKESSRSFHLCRYFLFLLYFLMGTVVQVIANRKTHSSSPK